MKLEEGKRGRVEQTEQPIKQERRKCIYCPLFADTKWLSCFVLWLFLSSRVLALSSLVDVLWLSCLVLWLYYLVLSAVLSLFFSCVGLSCLGLCCVALSCNVLSCRFLLGVVLDFLVLSSPDNS